MMLLSILNNFSVAHSNALKTSRKSLVLQPHTLSLNFIITCCQQYPLITSLSPHRFKNMWNIYVATCTLFFFITTSRQVQVNQTTNPGFEPTSTSAATFRIFTFQLAASYDSFCRKPGSKTYVKWNTSIFNCCRYIRWPYRCRLLISRHVILLYHNGILITFFV